MQFSNRKRDLEIEFKEKERQLKSDCRDIIDDFEKETRISLDAEKQVQKEDREMECEYER